MGWSPSTMPLDNFMQLHLMHLHKMANMQLQANSGAQG
jgi:hypothetical protein